MSLDGIVYMVRLLEMSLDAISIIDKRKITWPKTIGANEMPEVDGVLVLYDVMNQESIAEVPEILRMSFAHSCSCHSYTLQVR